MPRTPRSDKGSMRVLEGVDRALKRMLDLSGMNQAELARQMGVNETSVSRALSFRHSPSIGWIDNYLNELGVSVEDFAKALVEEATGDPLELDESKDARLMNIERKVNGLEERLASIETLLIRFLGR